MTREERDELVNIARNLIRQSELTLEEAAAVMGMAIDGTVRPIPERMEVEE